MNNLIHGLVSPDGSRVGRPVFASEEVYKREQKNIFQRNWLYLAHESQLKNPGDFVAASMGEIPIIVARSASGEITACIDSCTHRGLPLNQADKGNTSRFVCPYHNWAFSVDGDLVAVPQESMTAHKMDKKTRESLGLKRVPRIEKIFGLIFGSLNPEIEPLEQYLGDMRFYMEAFFERFPGGIAVVGSPHKWLLKANWKLPVENQMGDIGHAPFLHGACLSVFGQQNSAADLLALGVTAVPKAGHSAVIKLMSADADPKTIAWGIDSGSEPARLTEYLLDLQNTVAARLSPRHARIRGLALGIYPNLSLLWGNATLRVSHPRGPGKVEYWSWRVVPAEAPDDIKEMLCNKYNFPFGPGGLLEQEDSIAWSQQFTGSSIEYLHDTPYYYGLGMGEEGPHPELPGTIGKCYNEHFARQFYLRWYQEMCNEERLP